VRSAVSVFARAVALHREALSHLEAVRAALSARLSDGSSSASSAAQQRQLAGRLHDLTASVAASWWGCRLGPQPSRRNLGLDGQVGRPALVRIGDGAPLPDASFSVVVPFLGAGHLAIDVDARDRRVAQWLRGLLLRAVAALPDGAVRVLPVDGGTLGAVFAPFRSLMDAEAWAHPATDLDGLRTMLGEAEEQIAEAQAGTAELPYLIVACAALPAGAGGSELGAAGGAVARRSGIAGAPAAGWLPAGRGWRVQPATPAGQHISALRGGRVVHVVRSAGPAGV
jgi:DNA segregation ATPase FtsK/SpoIIIE, S-DNA-T family